MKLATRRAFATFALAMAAPGCSGGDYWLGGGSGPSSASGGASGVLTSDWPIDGSDSVEIGGSTPCRIVGNGHSILSGAAFSGQLWIHDCEFVGLGGADAPAIDVEVVAPGSVVIERSTFSKSGVIELWNDEGTTATFRDNVIYEDGAIPLDPSGDDSTFAFKSIGPSTEPKFCQGNRVYRGGLRFRSPNWLVGGDSDAESNILIGLRASIGVESSGIVVRGNYVHNEHVAGAGDELTLATSYDVSDALAEHNLLRRGTWIVRGFGGEFRYNALFDADNLAFVQQPFESTRLHHNLFAMCSPTSDGARVQGGVELVNTRTSGIELFNNTFDGGGTAVRFGGPAVSIDDGCMLDSLRSNLITSFWFGANSGDAAVRTGAGEGSGLDMERLRYADYNLFDNESEDILQNYGVGITGRSVRIDAGFGLNDAVPGGYVNQQVAPNLAAPNGCVPFTDDDFRTGRATVSQALATLRAAYLPLPGSAALGGGDPADGADNFIGAVGDGSLEADRFGRFAE